MGKFYAGVAEALTPYVRALAWWQAVPKAPPSKVKNPPASKDSRLDVRLKSGEDPDFPPIDAALEFLVAYLFDAGPVSAAGMGPVPLTWTDLESWQRTTGVFIPLWQVRVLRQLSAEYLAEAKTADEHDAPPPWNREVDRMKVAKHIRNVLRG